MPQRVGSRSAVHPSNRRPAPSAAEKELRTLIRNAPRPNPRVPYKAINPDDVSRWLTKHFGPIDQMSPEKAQEALRLMDGVGESAVMGVRPALFELQDQVEARTHVAPEPPAGWNALSPSAAAAAAGRDIDRLIENSPQPNPRVPYRAINPDAVEAIIVKYFGPIERMTPAQAKAAAPLLEDLGAGALMGLRPAFIQLHSRVYERTGEAVG